MAPQAEISLETPHSGETQRPTDPAKPAKIVIPVSQADRVGPTAIDHAAGSKIGPARGLVIGISVGIAFWAGLISLILRVFR